MQFGAARRGRSRAPALRQPARHPADGRARGRSLAAAPASVDVTPERIEFRQRLPAANAARLRHDPKLDQLARIIAVAGSSDGQSVSREVEA
ncbi:MAG: hypothetical protein FJ137_00755 [Deltaproteobacteria bacterium]|nr:hypothetical protein [Deltaproteobacteria bacterium]